MLAAFEQSGYPKKEEEIRKLHNSLQAEQGLEINLNRWRVFHSGKMKKRSTARSLMGVGQI